MDQSMNIRLSSVSRSSSGLFEMVKYSHLWTIHNFSFYYHKKSSDDLRSSTFLASKHVLNMVELEWYMNLVFTGTIMLSNRDFLRVYLNLSNPINIRGSAHCKFSILNSKNQIAFTFPSTVLLNSQCSDFCYFQLEISKLFENCNELLPKDTLSIYCEIWRDLSKEQVKDDVNVPCHQLSDDYKLLFNNERLSDVILSAAGTEFRAHKTVLAARSSVFEAMFANEMTESIHNKVDIIDIDPEALRELLRFIYTDELQNLNSMASELLVAADKYAMHKLKAICEKELCCQLYKDNVLRLLMLADLHNADQLKAIAIRFIKTHALEVMNTPEWKDVVQLRHLMDELLRP